MREWLRYFRIWFLVCAILIVIVCVYGLTSNEEAERINHVCTEEERVFDYADVLTDEEENSLRKLIAKREQQTQCDIVLVTMNESLEEYARSYDPNASGNDFTMIKADNFYDEHGFGWNKYKESDDGDGVLLLDNYYREADGKVYTWFSTSGRAMECYSTEMIDDVLDNVYEYIMDDPYEAYRAYVETVYIDLAVDFELPWLIAVVIPLIVAVIFIIVNLSGKEGKKTVTVSTYVNGGKPYFGVNRDQFIRKTVSKRRIQTSSSGGSRGGGGGHVSSGGHSHGGGGRSR